MTSHYMNSSGLPTVCLSVCLGVCVMYKHVVFLFLFFMLFILLIKLVVADAFVIVHCINLPHPCCYVYTIQEVNTL